jgi:hypothetical protein
MRSIKTISATLLLSSGLVAASHAEYAAKITVNTGNSFVVKELNIKGDRLYSDTGNASTSVSVITDVEFRFPGLNLKMCETMFRSGDRTSLESMLQQNIEPVMAYSYLPTNLGGYMEWLLRVQVWNGNQAGAGKTIGLMRKINDNRGVDAANLYFSLLLLDQGKADQAKVVFDTVMKPEEVSVPMAEYLNARFAVESGDYRKTMQHISKILAFHSRDFEWMGPATALEARVYKETGQLEKAASVANELTMAYPGTRWSKLGEEIKKELN